MKRKFLKASVPPDEFAAVVVDANAAGMTVSAFVRSALAQRRKAIGVDEALARIEQRLAASSGESSSAIELLLVEVLLLTRELAADRNAQLLSKVNSQLNARYPNRSKAS